MPTDYTPYPWQTRFWNRWDRTGSRRILISAPTGAGKTMAAEKLFDQYPQVVISGPGMSLEPWMRDVPSLAYIDQGPRKAMSKKAAARIEAALNAPVVFMTPQVLQKWADKLPKLSRRLLVSDEAHMYDDPATQRSEWLCRYLTDRPQVDFLPLTATFLRKEVQDVWSLGNIMCPEQFPGVWKEGEHRRISFSFLSKFCQRDPDMGFFFGARLDKLPELKERLRNFVEFVEPEEVLLSAPKAQISLTSMPREELIDDIATSLAESKCVMFEHVAVAEAYAAQLGWPCYHSDNSTTAQRVAAIDRLRTDYQAGKQANFVGCWRSFQESVDLAWVEKTLLFEPPTTPGQVEQLMGRWERPSLAQRVPAIVSIEASPSAMKRLGVLQERSSQADGVQGISPKVAGLLAAVKTKQFAPVVLALAADYDADIDYAIRMIDGEYDDESGDFG